MHSRWGILVLLGVLAFLPSSHGLPSCNDIEISPTHVNLVENEIDRSLHLTLENEDSHDFEVEDIRLIENHPQFDIRIRDIPDQINGDSTAVLRLEYDTHDVNADVNANFTIQIQGDFEGTNLDCSFSDLTFTIQATIQNSQNVCRAITVTSNDVSLIENSTIQHPIRIENPTDKDFTIEGFSIFDDSSAFSVDLNPRFSNASFERIIPANTTKTYPVDIDSHSVSSDSEDTAFIEIRGQFSDGNPCSFSEITGEFQITVEDTGVEAAVCSEISVSAPLVRIVSGETSAHSFSLLNNFTQTFYVDEYKIVDKNYQVNFEPLVTPEKIPFQDSGEFTFNATGYSNNQGFDSNAFLALKGHFTSGSTCIIPNKKIPFAFMGNAGAACTAFYAGIKPVNILKGTNTLEVYFHNPLFQEAQIQFRLNNGNVSPSQTTIPANEAKFFTLHFSNASENQTLQIQTIIPGCTIPNATTQLLFSGLDGSPVQLKNPPPILTLGSAKEFALTLENKSAFSQEAEITLITKPGNQKFTRTIEIPGLDEPLVFFPTSILQRKNVVIVQMKSAGYIVSHTIRLEKEEVGTTTTPAPTPTSGQPTVGTTPFAPTTGLLSGASGLGASLIVLIVVLLVWYFTRMRMETKPILLEELAAEELPEEPWMKPLKE